MTIDWQKSLESLRNDFRDASRSYPKLFHARLIGPIVSQSVWKNVLGEKRFLRFSDRPISDESCDQSCIYSAADSDEYMCKHGLTRFDTLAELAARALFEIPKSMLGLVHFKPRDSAPSPLLWLDFLDHLASQPGPPDSIKGFERDQFKVLQSEDQGSHYLLMPAIAHKSAPHLFPPEAFPHVWLALLSPDISTCSALAIDDLLRRLPDSAEDCIIATWVEADGCKTTWTIHDPEMLDTLKGKYGEPVELFRQEGKGVAGTSLISRLDSIPSGSDSAHNYHQCIAQILKRLFFPDLTGMKIEQEINEGRKRIDICFDNVAECGFFHDLKVAHQIKCPIIFLECKNYSSDPANPELDQLQGRFGRQRGCFGILLCRHVSDPDTLLRRCRDIVGADRGYVIALTDSDIKLLWQLRSLGNAEGFNQYLRERFKLVIM